MRVNNAHLLSFLIKVSAQLGLCAAWGTLLSPTPLKRLQAANQLGLVARGRVAWQLLDAHADRPLYLRNVGRGGLCSLVGGK